MTLQENLLLPPALRALRLRSGMSQKALALTIGVDQAVLCSVERGRRPALAEDLMKRIWSALKLSDDERRDLSWKVEHDRLIREIYLGKKPEVAPLVSAALMAHASLSPAGRSGLVTLLKSKARSGADVRDLESQAAEPTSGSGEAAMT